jgi:hypothetical protein
MKKESEDLIFKNRQNSILETLKGLQKKHFIDDETYGDFLNLTLSAMTIGQLDQIDSDLAEIVPDGEPRS